MSDQSDGNMAFVHPNIYQNIEKHQQSIMALLEFDKLKNIEDAIVTQKPDIA